VRRAAGQGGGAGGGAGRRPHGAPHHPLRPARAGGQLSVVHVLVSTAAAGVAQAVLGGQPLLIVGVAEPIVLIYGFM
jgi:hypothetical protein